MFSSLKWPSISENYQGINNTHCVPDSETAIFFPTKGRISDTLSPKTTMSGEILDYKDNLILHIGQYFHMHEEYAPHNINNPRTKGAISLGLSENLQGGFKCMALNTGKKTVWRSWDFIQMSDTVITRVNYLGSDQLEQCILPIGADVQSSTSKS